jgi:hypothetical protein
VRPLGESVVGDASGVEATTAAADLPSMGSCRPDHPLQVVVAIGRLLVLDGTGHGIAHQEDTDLVCVLTSQALRQPKTVVAAFSPVSGVAEDQEAFHGVASARDSHLDWEVGQAPFRQSLFQAPGPLAGPAEDLDRLRSQDAVRAAAVSHDLALARQVG